MSFIKNITGHIQGRSKDFGKGVGRRDFLGPNFFQELGTNLKKKVQNSRKKVQKSRKKGQNSRKKGTKLKKKVTNSQSSRLRSAVPPLLCSFFWNMILARLLLLFRKEEFRFA